MCQRIMVESATIRPMSSRYGSLPLGARRRLPRRAWYGRPASLSSISALVTKGLASGSPKAGPKV